MTVKSKIADMSKFSVWLENQYLEWQRKQGKRQTQAQFADTLGINVSVLNRYMNGRQLPTEENVHKLAEQLGPDVYDLLGLARPDPNVQKIVSQWQHLPTWLQNRILREIERAEKGELTNDEAAESYP